MKGKKARGFKVLISVTILALITSGCNLQISGADDKAMYDEGVSLMESGDYEQAVTKFNSMKNKDYRDTNELINQCKDSINNKIYEQAMEKYKVNDFNGAVEIFESLGDYKDSDTMAKECLRGNKAIYLREVSNLLYRMNKGKELCCSTSDIIIDVWNKANTNGEDATAVLRKAYTDYSENINNVNSEKEVVDGLIAGSSNNVLSDGLYDKIYEEYVLYDKLYKGLMSPTGTVSSFEINIDDLSKKFDIGFQKLYTAEPDLRKYMSEVEEAYKKAEEEQAKSLLISESEVSPVQ